LRTRTSSSANEWRLIRALVGATGIDLPDATASGLDITHQDLEATNERWLFPAPENSSAPFTPLTAWWVLLFGLSIVARYDPGTWSRALNLDDSSGYAVPLRLVLDEALARLPWIILTALTGKAKVGTT
jgi:hypothetical protein